MNRQTKHSFEPLIDATSFRLIELLPGELGDKLECQIYHADLQQSPAYEAVSYVWGSEADKIPISCNGDKLYITQNLTAALQRFRWQTTRRTLWVDSVCIEQDNMLERNHQVKVMSRIYRSASCVLIWLGEGEESDNELSCATIILLLERFWSRCNELEQWWNVGPVKPNLIRNMKEISTHFDIPLPDCEGIEAIGRLLSNSWFYRAWTYQESFLAKERVFHFGSYAVEGILMVYVMAIFRGLYKATDDARFMPYQQNYTLPMIMGPAFWTQTGSRS
jgi:Heterokaryon incompatibility protein (HET)